MKRDSFRTTLAILALSVTLLSSLMASELSEQVIIAEYDGGKITKELLKQRLEKIPSFYRQRYETNEGKQKLLDTMCTEELFYAEAIDRNLQNDPEVEKRTKWEKTRFLFQRYKRDLIDNTQFSKDEILEYYREHEESYKAGTLEEATPDIRRKLLQENQSKIEADILDSLKTKYNVKIIHQVIDSTTIKYLEEPEKIKKDIMFVSSDSPELNYTLSEFVTLYSLIDMRSFVNIDTVKKLRDYVDRIVEMKLYYIDALANEYPAKAGLQDELAQIERTTLLRTIYNRLVVEDIDLSEEAARNYYEDNIKDFSTLHNRAIQTFVFKNKKAAENAYKKVKKALGYGFLGIRTGKIDSVKINEIIEESSEFSNNNGIIENIYDNGIIPGHGKDKYYSKKIWEIPSEEAKPHKLSDIFQNSKDEYVFFRIVEDNVAQAIPFEEVKEKVKRKMLKDLSQKKFKALEKELSEKFNLKKYPEKLIVKLTAEEYFKKAEDAQKRNNFKQAVYFYDQIIKYYPESQDEYKAKFMKGFVYAEDLNEKSAALDIFQNLVEKYPDGELNESAEYMIQELEGKNNIIEKIIEEK